MYDINYLPAKYKKNFQKFFSYFGYGSFQMQGEDSRKDQPEVHS
jgi:hypothetical protein